MNFKIIFFAAIALLTISSCKKSSTAPTKVTDVYVAGSVIAPNGKKVATYWKNGVQITLADTSLNSDSRKIIVKGNDVYVLGEVQVPGSFAYIATYWKNGTATKITTNGPSSFSATSITVSGSDVYVAGNFNDKDELGNSYTEAVYWKNGVFTRLVNDAGINNYYTAFDIAINNNDVYVVGNEFSYGIIGNSGVYWKNGAINHLNKGTSDASAITIDGNDVYIAGDTTGRSYIPVYWKNGEIHALDGVSGAYPGKITVQGGDVYVVGSYIFNGFNPTIAYWKNKTVIALWSTLAYGSAIAVNGADVYVTGQIMAEGGYSLLYANTAIYWKNNNIIELVENAEAVDIVVIQQ